MERYEWECKEYGEPFNKPCLDVETRWNSTLAMLEHACKAPKALQQTARRYDSKISELTNDQWAVVKWFCSFLAPFKDATEKCSAESVPTMNCYSPICEGLLKHINMQISNNTHPPDLANALIKCKTYLETKYDEATPIIVCASVLDPSRNMAYFRNVFKNNAEFLSWANQHWKEAFESYSARVHSHRNDESGVSSNGTQSEPDVMCWDVGMDPDVETESKSEADYVDQKQKHVSCLLKYWAGASSSGDCPVLCVMARDYLAVQASSVPCERLFSVAGHIVRAKRGRLTGSTIMKLLCLKYWEFDSLVDAKIVQDTPENDIFNVEEYLGEEEDEES